MDNPENGDTGYYEVVRHWYQVPQVGNMIWLVDDGTEVKGTVQQVTWTEDVVVAWVA